MPEVTPVTLKMIDGLLAVAKIRVPSGVPVLSSQVSYQPVCVLLPWSVLLINSFVMLPAVLLLNLTAPEDGSESAVLLLNVYGIPPIAPVAPAVPVGPAAPVEPVGPVGPVLPVAPVAPVAPTEPVGPVGPVAPVAPVEPVGPVGPVGPVPPVAPVGPTAFISAPSWV